MSTTQTTTVKRKWGIDFNNQLPSGGANIGPSSSQHVASRVTKADHSDLKLKKAWEVAKGPGKGILMTAFMLWMAGGGVNIFSMMITVYAIINPVKAIIGTNGVFSKFEDAKGGSLLEPKLVYIGLNVLSLAVAVYKCSTLGLLPTTPSDWIAYFPLKKTTEFSAGGFI